ncbi:uncharacterized protein LOC132197341 [Neocloeon triangulifer]|uniref:uncharacterized protein LOC132197341 n=1 Tax=Neocloeon triangulifer TaxID=2078957 RepID=UPI00286F57B8|nr:uncharacterized protein LOC132197341 [Neocloeon triangulifer]
MKVLVCLTVSLFFLGVSQALDCHTCDSERPNEEYCKDPFKKPAKAVAMSCTASFQDVFNTFRSAFTENQDNAKLESCVKHTYLDEHGHIKRVVRGCATGYDDVCKTFQQVQGNYQCGFCKTSYCNGATSVSGVSAVVIALVSFLMSFKM